MIVFSKKKIIVILNSLKILFDISGYRPLFPFWGLDLPPSPNTVIWGLLHRFKKDRRPCLSLQSCSWSQHRMLTS